MFINFMVSSKKTFKNVIMDAPNFPVELLDKIRYKWTDVILLNAKNIVQQRLLMCCFNDSVWSRCTPRYLREL